MVSKDEFRELLDLVRVIGDELNVLSPAYVNVLGWLERVAHPFSIRSLGQEDAYETAHRILNAISLNERIPTKERRLGLAIPPLRQLEILPARSSKIEI